MWRFGGGWSAHTGATVSLALSVSIDFFIAVLLLLVAGMCMCVEAGGSWVHVRGQLGLDGRCSIPPSPTRPKSAPCVQPATCSCVTTAIAGSYSMFMDVHGW